MRVEYREEPCRSALNRVQGMPFDWSLNPYTGCAHRCTFCYVRAFELRADRPADDRYGASIRVKTNVAEVLHRELARASWEHGAIAIGAATDPYQPAEGRYRLTRACIEVLAAAANPFSIITRGPMIVRDLDVLTTAARRADVSVTFSIPTLDTDIWRRTEPGTAPPHQRLRALTQLVEAGVRVGVGMAPILPGLTGRSSSPRSYGRRAQPERPACGRTSSTSARARRSTSSARSRAIGPSSCRSTSACTRAARTCRRRGRTPCGRRCASSRGSTACATGARCGSSRPPMPSS